MYNSRIYKIGLIEMNNKQIFDFFVKDSGDQKILEKLKGNAYTLFI